MMRMLLLITSLLCAAAGSVRNFPLPAVPKPLDNLSEYGFFVGSLQQLNPSENVIPYNLQTPLFSNYAEKARFIRIPEGAAATFNSSEEFALPVGTYLIKNFFYPTDFRNPSGGKRLMETRLMYRDESGWQTWPYIWNDAQTDAYYDPTGDNRMISYINESGKTVKTQYLIPNKNQCKGCHLKQNEVVPIGIAARHLNHDYAYATGIMNQLLYWKEKGILKDLPEVTSIGKHADWQNPAEPLEARARAYLDINCGHCHRPEGAAATSGLFLHAHEVNSTALGILKTPVAAGRGSGGRMYDIVPGKPDASILLYRMQTNDPGIAMPEIGREQVHAEGIALIKDWIKHMKSPQTGGSVRMAWPMVK